MVTKRLGLSNQVSGRIRLAALVAVALVVVVAFVIVVKLPSLGIIPKSLFPGSTLTSGGPVAIPEKVLANQFGFLGGGEPENPFIGDAGAAWMRPHPGPFLWDAMQTSPGSKISFAETDATVRNAQAQNYGLLATLWPFADWDQKNHPQSANCKVSSNDEFLPRSKESLKKGRQDYLPQYRCNPADWLVYQTWVRSVVERYDGDGASDMAGLAIPIKYWEVMNEPDLDSPEPEPRLDFYKEGPTEYVELLIKTYAAIKAADPEAQVLVAGAAGGDSQFLNFYATVFKNPEAREAFDISNVHCISNDRGTNDFNVGAYKRMLAGAGVTKPIWVTEAEAFTGQTAEENYLSTKRSTTGAIKAGAERIFFTRYSFDDFRKDMSEKTETTRESVRQSEQWYRDIISL